MVDEERITEEGTSSMGFSEADGLREELVELRERSDRLLTNWQRSQADLSNFRRQVAQEQEERSATAIATVLTNLLPVLDDLDRAIVTIAPELLSYSWMDGIWLIHKRLLVVMTAFGLEEIDSEGKEFNPNLHQSVAETGGEQGKVVSVLQKGYTFQKRLLRPSLVTVGNTPRTVVDDSYDGDPDSSPS